MDKLDIPQEELDSLVTELAGLLGETQKSPVKQIRKIIQYCGTDFAREIYKETVEIEAKGGMMLVKQERRRTTGEFFSILRVKKFRKNNVRSFSPLQKLSESE